LIRWALSGAINLFPGQRATPPAGFVVHCLMNGRQISAPLFRDKTLLGGSCFSVGLPSIFLSFGEQNTTDYGGRPSSIKAPLAGIN